MTHVNQCQATEPIDCPHPAIANCQYCGMQICSAHEEDGYCLGTDCRDEEQREANARELMNFWEMGESLIWESTTIYKAKRF